VLQLRALRHDLEELVGLLLVLDHREGDLGVLEDVDHLLRDRVLVERHRDGAQGLGGGERPVEARAVGADDGDVRAAAEPGLREPAASASTSSRTSPTSSSARCRGPSRESRACRPSRGVLQQSFGNVSAFRLCRVMAILLRDCGLV
jgi:hypothetical protein